MRILIVDDEPAARGRLRGLLAEIDPDLAVVAEAGDGVEALLRIAETSPDLVLLDIGLPRLNGLDAAREIARLERAPAVVFVTAHDEFAVQAFEVSAVDYLLKPVRKERLAAALQKASRFTAAAWQGLEAAFPPEQRPARSHLCIYRHGALRLVPVASVVYFRADSKYVTVRTPEYEDLLDESLVALEQEFGDRFLRIHRNALVAPDRIAGLVRLSLARSALRLDAVPETLEVSRRHLPALRARLKRLAETPGRG
jgi:two-component system response regulator AlgR